MATAEEYETALRKAENLGVSSLTDAQMELLNKLYREAGSRGNRARRVLDGK